MPIVQCLHRKAPNHQIQLNPPGVRHLTQEQMRKAITVQDGLYRSRLHRKGEVYRLESCKRSAAPQTPCYFKVVQGVGGVEKATSVSPLSYTNATLTCGIDVYDSVGIRLGRLQQNVNTTFLTGYYRTPVVFNWGDLRGTWAVPGYTWSNLQGPNPNPAWGQRSGDYASSIASGELHLLIQGFPIWGYYSTRLVITPYGWYCQ